jgi:3-mercaptopropionate dioxygenase
MSLLAVLIPFSRMRASSTSIVSRIATLPPGKSPDLVIYHPPGAPKPGLAWSPDNLYNLDMKNRLGTEVPASRCLGELVSGVRAATRRGATWAVTAGLVADQLRLHLPGPEVLTAGQRYGDPAGYRCHLLHVEPDGSFSVTALVWRPGQATPVHDHVTWCVSGVIAGAEREERYVLRDDGWLEQAGESVNLPGDVAALAPPGDIHRVLGAGSDNAISVHVYGTDISRLGSSVRRTYDLPVVALAPA